MDIFRKVNAVQLYLFWRNLAVSLLVFVATIAFSQMLPPFLSSVVSLVCAGVLYSMMYTNKIYHNSSCMIIVYAFFLILMTYTFFTITLNLLFYLRIVDTSWNFILFEIDPFLPSLVLIPIGTIVLAYIYLRSGKLALCTDCKISRGDMYSRGKLGFILNQEAKYQLRNLLSLFFSLSLIMWTYYLLFYININVNSRDKYVFIWLAVICFIIDEIYFIFRYYNLYMDLMENDEVLNEEDLESISNTIYLRVYIISGNSVYVNPDTPALDNPEKNVIDTPFFFKVPEYEIDNNEKVSEYVGNMIGYENGELKPFFKQRN